MNTRALLTVLAVIAAVLPSFAWEYIPSVTVHREQFSNDYSPTDIVFTDDDEWLLYSAFNGVIYRYSAGVRTGSHRSAGLRYGICFVGVGDGYYFCDSANSVLRELDSNFSYVARLTFGGGQQGFDPTDVVGSGNEIYVVDNDNHRVIRYNPAAGEITATFGMLGTTRGYLRYPFSAVVDSDSLLYVSEVLNGRLQMFAPTGRSTLIIGEWGVEPGKLYRPKGLALIDDEFLVVSDGYMGVLQVFDVYGEYIGVITDEGGEIRKYSSPTRIRAYGHKIAVLDYYDHIFEIIEVGRFR